jgi:hypothetical protein
MKNVLKVLGTVAAPIVTLFLLNAAGPTLFSSGPADAAIAGPAMSVDDSAPSVAPFAQTCNFACTNNAQCVQLCGDFAVCEQVGTGRRCVLE